MLAVTFGGWVQCRLATDPDPYDEPRGVSGYLHAYAGEPDLDRIIRFQNPPYQRAFGPSIGVSVRSVARNGVDVPSHACVGALVDLLDEPKFEGRNGVVAEDTLEPVYPFKLELRRNGAFVQRSVVPADPAFPYRELFSTGRVPALDIQRATNITDLRPVWLERLGKLRVAAGTATDAARPGIIERIEYIERSINARPLSGPGALGLSMLFEYQLRSAIAGDAAQSWTTDLFPGADLSEAPWPVRFWFGGWDSDAQCFYCQGTLSIAEQREPDGPFVPTRRAVPTS